MGILKEKFGNSSMLELLWLCWLDWKVNFWNNLEIWDTVVVLPKSYKNFTWKKSIWAVHLFLNISLIDFSDLDDKKYNFLIENELTQLQNLYKILKAYEKSKSSFFEEIPNDIELIITNLSQSINKNSSLWQFLKVKLIEKNTEQNYDDLLQEYFFYKQNFLEQSNTWKSDEQDNEWINDYDSYSEHDWNIWESIEWEDLWVFWVIDPIVNSIYFSEKIFNWFNHNTWKFIKTDNSRNKLIFHDESQVTNYYSYSGNKWVTYVLPIERFNLKVYSWDSEEVEVFEDNDWNYTLKFLKDCKTNIWLKIEKNEYKELLDKTEDLLYTWGKIDISSFDNPFDIIKWIRENKKYKNVNQEQFTSNSINNDIEKLFEAEEFDCLQANKLFTVLCRSIWFPSRLVIWKSAYAKKDKDNNIAKTYLSKNKWHAWTEVFLDWKWQIIDATPVKNDNNDNLNENWDLLNSVEEIIEVSDEQIWEWDKLEIKEAKNETREEVEFVLDKAINNQYFESALEYVKHDASEIVIYIQDKLKERKEEMQRRQLSAKKSKKKRRMSNWKIEVNSDTLIGFALWDPNNYTNKQKLTAKNISDIDTRLKDLSVAIDVSWSMWKLTWNWESWNKADYAYLSLVLVYLVCKNLDISFNKAVLFEDKIMSWTPEEILGKFYVWWWNQVNDKWIGTSLKSIKDSTKWLCIILSDWDWATWQAFFNDDSRTIFKNNKNIYSLGYWLWKDAAWELKENITLWKIPTVIEFRMWEADNNKQTQWYPLENYKNLVPQLKKDLKRIMCESNVKF